MDDPQLELLNDLRESQKEMLKELKSLNRKGRAAEFVGIAMIVLPAFSLITGNISLAAGVGWIGIGLLLSVMAVRYLLTAASLPASQIAIDHVHREIERIQDLELDHPMYAGR